MRVNPSKLIVLWIVFINAIFYFIDCKFNPEPISYLLGGIIVLLLHIYWKMFDLKKGE